jgi:hypothetical protein
MLQWDGVVVKMRKVLVMMHGGDDDDPDEARLDGDDLPSPGRNFPGRFLPTGELSLYVCFPPCRGDRVYL